MNKEMCASEDEIIKKSFQFYSSKKRRKKHKFLALKQRRNCKELLVLKMNVIQNTSASVFMCILWKILIACYLLGLQSSAFRTCSDSFCVRRQIVWTYDISSSIEIRR